MMDLMVNWQIQTDGTTKLTAPIIVTKIYDQSMTR